MGQKLSACDCRKGHGGPDAYQPMITNENDGTIEKNDHTVPKSIITPTSKRERTSSLSLGWDEEATIQTELSSASKSIENISPLKSPSSTLSSPRDDPNLTESPVWCPPPQMISSRYDDPCPESDLDDSTEKKHSMDEKGTERAPVCIVGSTDTDISRTDESIPANTNNEEEGQNHDSTMSDVLLSQEDTIDEKGTENTSVPVVDSTDTNIEEDAATRDLNLCSSDVSHSTIQHTPPVVSGNENCRSSDMFHSVVLNTDYSPTTIIPASEQVREDTDLSKDKDDCDDRQVEHASMPAPVVLFVDSIDTSKPEEAVSTQNTKHKEEEPKLVTTSTLRFTTLDLPGTRNARFPCSPTPRSIQNSILNKSSRSIKLTLPEHCNSQLCLRQTLRFAVLDFKN